MTRVLSLFVCLAATTVCPAFAQSSNASVSTRIAFFSPSRAFAESADGKAATARLTRRSRSRKGQQQGKGPLEKLSESLANDGGPQRSAAPSDKGWAFFA